VIMLPDEFLARNVATETAVKIIAWKGHCEVHERFTAEEVRQLRENHPDIVVLAHPECPPDVVAEADFTGSTAALVQFVEKRKPPRVVLLTECSMSDNVATQHPDIEFIRPCNLCPHMKRITLGNIRQALEQNQHVVTIDPALAARARLAVERMLAI
jgi:quinolinate synthase